MKNNRQKKAIREWNHAQNTSHNVTGADIAYVRLLARQAAQAVFDAEQFKQSTHNNQGN